MGTIGHSWALLATVLGGMIGAALGMVREEGFDPWSSGRIKTKGNGVGRILAA